MASIRTAHKNTRSYVYHSDCLTRTFNRRVTRTAGDAKIAELRQRLNLSQTVFGGRLNSSAMSVSRWERGNQEPSADSYIELGNLAGAPVCWYFWGRAGLQADDLMRAMPKLG